MSKLMLVSDYDGTLKRDIKNLKINIECVNKFRKNGNLFAISTGRSYHSIKKECIKYNINYDYLFCNNGAVLFDYNDNIIYQKYFDEEILQKINSVVENCITSKNNSCCDNNEEMIDKIIELYLKLDFFNACLSIHECINCKYVNFKILKYLIYVFLKKTIDKSIGLQILADRLSNDIPKKNIITVGNNYNDLTMLKDFNGYRLTSSYPFLIGKGLNVTDEVHVLIKKLDKSTDIYKY